jgi:hypothetical protein
MKTPREFLFQRHRCAESQLDAIRARTLAELSRAKSQSREENSISPLPFFAAWRQIFLSLRWHFAGISVAWFFILLLNRESSSSVMATVTNQSSPTPKQLVLALRENRRQIAEMIESPLAISPAISGPQPSVPPRRSEFQTSTEMA